MKAYKFRIYPSKEQEKLLKHHLWIEKELWNELLEANKKKCQEEKKFLTKNEMQEVAKGRGLYAQVAQTLSHRLYDALWCMVKMRKKGKKCGFPRFKNMDRIKSLKYPQAGFSLGKKLEVTPFGEISIKKHREIEGKIKTLTMKRESTGKWFAIFCVECELQTMRKNMGPEVGIDLGLKNLAVLSDGVVIDNPRHLKKHEEELAWNQRRFARKKKGSENRKKAKRRIALINEKVVNTRADFLHKTTSQLVNDYSIIGLEKLTSQEMAGQNFGKSINDAGWNMFANMIAYKAESAGCKVVFVDPRNTTQECSNCHKIVKKDLAERMHNCPFCGLTIDRDLNAARNILIRATAGHAESNACGDEVLASSLKQEAHTIRGREHVTSVK